MDENEKIKVFIGYAKEDKEFALKIYNYLKNKKKFAPWIAVNDLNGKKISTICNKIIPEHKHFIFIESEHSKELKSYKTELDLVIELRDDRESTTDIEIYPILLDINEYSDNRLSNYPKIFPTTGRWKANLAKHILAGEKQARERSSTEVPFEEKSNKPGTVIRKFLKTHRKIIIVVFICIVVVAGSIILFGHYFTNQPKNSASNKETKQDTNTQTGNEKDTTIIKDTTVKPPNILNEQDPLPPENDNRNKIDTPVSNSDSDDKIDIDITDEILEYNFILETAIEFEDDYISEISLGNKKILNEICNKLKNYSELILWLIQETNIPLKNRNDKELSNTFNERGKNVYDYFKKNCKDVELKYKLDTPYVENTKKYNKLIIKIYRK